MTEITEFDPGQSPGPEPGRPDLGVHSIRSPFSPEDRRALERGEPAVLDVRHGESRASVELSKETRQELLADLAQGRGASPRRIFRTSPASPSWRHHENLAPDTRGDSPGDALVLLSTCSGKGLRTAEKRIGVMSRATPRGDEPGFS